LRASNVTLNLRPNGGALINAAIGLDILLGQQSRSQRIEAATPARRQDVNASAENP
jgi:hypothetical protein